MINPVALDSVEGVPFNQLASTLRAEDVMLCGVTSIDCRQPIEKAVSLMLQKKITSLPVVHLDSLIGMLTDKDLLKSFFEVRYLPGRVEEYMTDRLVTFNIEDSFACICQCLMETSFRGVPILRHNKLAGMITRSDLLRTFLRNNPSLTRTNDRPLKTSLTAENAMQCGLHTLNPEASLIEAMGMMTTHHTTSVSIVSPTLALLGILTEKDCLQAIQSPEVMSATVDDYMTRNVVTFNPSSRLGPICECLLARNFHQVPIVDQDKLVGIITRSDILKTRTKTLRL
jgi:CBS domain-containing protein